VRLLRAAGSRSRNSCSRRKRRVRENCKSSLDVDICSLLYKRQHQKKRNDRGQKETPFIDKKWFIEVQLPLIETSPQGNMYKGEENGRGKRVQN
jgi:hypothetical protein